MNADYYGWNSTTQALFLHQVHAIAHLPSGAQCLFVPLTDDIGAKLYYTECARNSAASTQQMAFTKDLAPRVGDSFHIDWNNLFVAQPDGLTAEFRRISIYGYLTQRAQTGGPFERQAISALIRRLNALGAVENYDDSDANFGVIDGRLVCIDFDEGSWT